ncbi:glycosyltransferase family 2 protein [Paenibacillus sp. FSL H7-0350]|uniref:glycosyltransferase family 2 protein n=1 Tax=Paenibacillus sp. FSL H7-0350 TaxID=2975345 RepID=UPI0031598CF4
MNSSVIIPTYNKSFFLDLTLAGFAKQSIKNFEVIIINDGSTDNTESIVKRYENQIDIKYFEQENSGRSKARNLGMSIARGDIFVFCDDDRIPVTNFISNHVNHIQNYKNSVSVGLKEAVLSRYTNSVKTFYIDPSINLIECFADFFRRNQELLDQIGKDKAIDLISTELLQLDLNYYLNKYRLYTCIENFLEVVEYFDNQLDKFPMNWMLATTGNLALHRFNCESITFDENFQGWGIEDNDFAYQLKNAGYDFYFNSNAINFHQEHPRNTGIDRAQAKENIQRFFNKYRTSDIKLYDRFFNGEYSLQELIGLSMK